MVGGQLAAGKIPEPVENQPIEQIIGVTLRLAIPQLQRTYS
jgi:hypothetical protein